MGDILNNFFLGNKANVDASKVASKEGKGPNFFKGDNKEGMASKPVVDRSKVASKEDTGLDLVQDSCIDWGALTPREVAAAFMMLKGGSKEAAEDLLIEVLAELKTMETADWGLR